MSVFCVYTHAKPDGSIFYVGKGSLKRAKEIRRKNNPHHCHIVAKYGRGNIQTDWIICDSEEDALAREIEAIQYLRSVGHNLVNITLGGDGVTGLKHSAITKAKISVASLGRKKPESMRIKLSAKMSGANNPMYGKEKTIKEKKQQSKKVSGLKNGNADHKIYLFRHKNGLEFIGAQTEFRKIIGIPQSCLAHHMRGKHKSTFGWQKIKEINIFTPHAMQAAIEKKDVPTIREIN
jgi:hypothetical protein